MAAQREKIIFLGEMAIGKGDPFPVQQVSKTTAQSWTAHVTATGPTCTYSRSYAARTSVIVAWQREVFEEICGGTEKAWCLHELELVSATAASHVQDRNLSAEHVPKMHVIIQVARRLQEGETKQNQPRLG